MPIKNPSEKLGDYHDLLNFGECICIPKNTLIVGRESHATSIYYLKSGIAALTDLLENGDERIYRYHKTGEFLGIFQLYNQVPSLLHAPEKTTCDLYDSIAKTECILYKIEPQVFLTYVYANPELLIEQFRMVAKVNMTHCLRHTKMLKNLTANIICSVLIDFSSYRNGALRLNRYFTYAEIARYLGVHVVTVGRIMKQLTLEHIICRDQGEIVILNQEQLLKYQDGEKLKY